MYKGPVRRGNTVSKRGKRVARLSGGNRSKAAVSNKKMTARYVT